MTQRPMHFWRDRRTLSQALIISIAIVLLLGLIFGTTARPGQINQNPLPSKNQAFATPGVSPQGAVSPLLFGTNMALFDSNDQLLHSPAARRLLQSIHTRIVRMPVRASLSNNTEIQAARVIKAIGAAPLVILRGAVDTRVLADDTRIINDMNLVFGNSIVYYEYGNEEDLLGVDVVRYVRSWNTIVPQLKRIARHGHFIGPVNFQYDAAYLGTFLQRANPRPDEISWHEYTCPDAADNASCIAHIDHWTTHIQDARTVMHTIIGSDLPIMITEWNYAPDARQNDGKNNNPSFITAWTSKALTVLARNHVFASMQYSCTNTAISLISNANTLTTQGSVFRETYQNFFGPRASP